jgi:uncharacterized damage-inducible protein DinB
MQRLEWFERKFTFGFPKGMLPFFLERLEGTLTRLEKKLATVSEEVLSEKVDGKWSIKQNIGHLAEVDQIALKRVEEMLQGISPMSPAVFEPKLDYNAKPLREVLKYFREVRTANLEKYKSLSDADLGAASLHPRLNVKMNPVDLAYFDAEHDDHHLVKINDILLKLKK